MSFVTSDGWPDEFGPIEGWYEGSDETTIVLSVVPKPTQQRTNDESGKPT